MVERDGKIDSKVIHFLDVLKKNMKFIPPIFMAHTQREMPIYGVT
jgi:hypothetical protein